MEIILTTLGSYLLIIAVLYIITLIILYFIIQKAVQKAISENIKDNKEMLLYIITKALKEANKD